MKLKLTALAAAALCMASAGATAAPDKPAKIFIGRMTLGYTYFNRPGADLAVHNETVKACAAEAQKVTYAGEARGLPPYYQTGNYTSAGLVGGAIGNAIADGMILSNMQNGHMGAVASALENCMLVHGWRVVFLSESEGEALEKLSQADLTAKLSAWIGAETPHGKIVRVFANDAYLGTNQRIISWPQHMDSAQFSFTVATGKGWNSYKPGAKEEKSPGEMLVSRGLVRLDDTDRQAMPTTEATLVLTMTGLGAKAGPSLTLEHIGPNGVADDSVLLDQRLHAFTKKDGDTAAFTLKPGRWRLAAIGGLTFCLGAPSFEVKAGEVVFAGAFAFAAPELGPVMTLDHPKAWLGPGPVADALKPASYVNGSTGACGGNEIYALEFPGAPFEAGYHWGGAPAGP